MASFNTKSYFEYNTFVKEGDLYVNKSSTYLNVLDEANNFYHFELFPGFITDGGSIPKGFQWFVKPWSDDNILMNLAYAIHDFCYGSECISKELSDDLLRSVLRDAGLSRLKASTVCFCVQKFAKRHYGQKHDKFDCVNHGSLTIL